ncbi:hypothetical protein B0H63DRAFT_521598 [Podospora didyma]|uniref:Ribosomal protein S15 n=1 Tax=Podospora didyma TaxID=330526 RepID=A0AAE0NTQ5_9PEZI|nr:hypothetical protein B0H63DRAFT_521598 [Podospora didyma]
MPPRIPGPNGLRTITFCFRPTVSTSMPTFPPLMQKANLSRKEKTRLMKQDQYGWAQKQQRKAVAVARQDELQTQRDAEWGSPVHGITTPFIESFDAAGQLRKSRPPVDEEGNPLREAHKLPMSKHLRNYQLSQDELETAIKHAAELSKPLVAENRMVVDPEQEKADKDAHEAQHAKAVIALRRITGLQNASAKDRKHANIRRCIETFGRHNTDKTVPNAAPQPARGVVPEHAVPRAGPDTGSSEVQIAILTAKIRALALVLEGPKGHRDKQNKRSMRSLCHRRQRLLRYMERKERGSGRWEHMIQTLGLSPATWKEQITL